MGPESPGQFVTLLETSIYKPNPELPITSSYFSSSECTFLSRYFSTGSDRSGCIVRLERMEGEGLAGALYKQCR